MEGQSELSELSAISWVSVVEGYLLSGFHCSSCGTTNFSCVQNFLYSKVLKNIIMVKKCHLGLIVLEGPSMLQMCYYFAKHTKDW